MNEKEVKQRLKEIDQEMAITLKQQSEAVKPFGQKISVLQKEKNKIEIELKAIKEEPQVSDHALVRYYERKYGCDFDDVRGQILTPNVCAAIKSGAKSYTSEGMRYVIEDNKIITVLEN